MKKPFGYGSNANEMGYDLSLLLSWMEDIVGHEADKKQTKKRAQKIEWLEEAIANIYKIIEDEE